MREEIDGAAGAAENNGASVTLRDGIVGVEAGVAVGARDQASDGEVGDGGFVGLAGFEADVAGGSRDEDLAGDGERAVDGLDDDRTVGAARNHAVVFAGDGERVGFLDEDAAGERVGRGEPIDDQVEIIGGRADAGGGGEENACGRAAEVGGFAREVVEDRTGGGDETDRVAGFDDGDTDVAGGGEVDFTGGRGGDAIEHRDRGARGDGDVSGAGRDVGVLRDEGGGRGEEDVAVVAGDRGVDGDRGGSGHRDDARVGDDFLGDLDRAARALGSDGDVAEASDGDTGNVGDIDAAGLGDEADIAGLGGVGLRDAVDADVAAGGDRGDLDVARAAGEGGEALDAEEVEADARERVDLEIGGGEGFGRERVGRGIVGLNDLAAQGVERGVTSDDDRVADRDVVDRIERKVAIDDERRGGVGEIDDLDVATVDADVVAECNGGGGATETDDAEARGGVAGCFVTDDNRGEAVGEREDVGEREIERGAQRRRVGRARGDLDREVQRGRPQEERAVTGEGGIPGIEVDFVGGDFDVAADLDGAVEHDGGGAADDEAAGDVERAVEGDGAGRVDDEIAVQRDGKVEGDVVGDGDGEAVERIDRSDRVAEGDVADRRDNVEAVVVAAVAVDINARAAADDDVAGHGDDVVRAIDDERVAEVDAGVEVDVAGNRHAVPGTADDQVSVVATDQVIGDVDVAAAARVGDAERIVEVNLAAGVGGIADVDRVGALIAADADFAEAVLEEFEFVAVDVEAGDGGVEGADVDVAGGLTRTEVQVGVGAADRRGDDDIVGDDREVLAAGIDRRADGLAAAQRNDVGGAAARARAIAIGDDRDAAG